LKLEQWGSPFVQKYWEEQVCDKMLDDDGDEFFGMKGNILGALAKLRKATVRFVMSVCPPPPATHMEQLGSHWTDFYEILYLSIFRRSV
jgi:hypothetical protein